MESKFINEKILLNHQYEVDIYQYCSLNDEVIVNFKEKLKTNKYKIVLHPCPICGNDSKWLNVAYSKEGFTWAICQECGLLQNNNRFLQSDLNSFYKTGEYHRLCMGNLPNDKHFELYSKVGGRSLLLDLELFNYDIKDKRILDIGCGPGATLLALKNAGAIVKGYDIDNERIEYGKQFIGEIECRDAFDSSIDFNGYDLIVINGVLEHLYNPQDFLNKLSKKIISASTNVIIHVPNLEFCFAYSDVSFLKFLHIGHIWYFTSISIERCLNSAGFQIENIVPRSANMGILCSKSPTPIVNRQNSYRLSVNAINFANLRNAKVEIESTALLNEIYEKWSNQTSKDKLYNRIKNKLAHFFAARSLSEKKEFIRETISS